jgi:hypothetical protein
MKDRKPEDIVQLPLAFLASLCYSVYFLWNWQTDSNK